MYDLSNLLGRCPANTSQLLSQDDASIQAGHNAATPPRAAADPNEDGGARLYSSSQPERAASGQRKETPRHSPPRRYHERSTWADHDADEDEEDEEHEHEHAASETDSPIEGPPGANYVQPQSQRPQFERQCARTLQFSNLAEGVTHADITGAVRGGVLLDVFLRAHDRSATVSFISSADAKKFHDHVRRHDLYIRNKRVGKLGLMGALPILDR